MDLSKNLNVSRNTVRESIKVLEALGFIEHKPGRGAFVAKTSDNDTDSVLNWFEENEEHVSEFMDIRLATETTAIKQAIKKSSDKEIILLTKELLNIQAKFDNASDQNDVVKMEYYDRSFHNEIAKASKDKLLIAIDNLIEGAFSGYRLKVFLIKENAMSSSAVHKKIIDAINNKNLDEGAAAVVNNLNNYLFDIKRMIKNK